LKTTEKFFPQPDKLSEEEEEHQEEQHDTYENDNGTSEKNGVGDVETNNEQCQQDEMNGNEETTTTNIEKPITSRSGRVIKKPVCYL